MSLCEFVLLLCLWGVPAWPSSIVLTVVNILFWQLQYNINCNGGTTTLPEVVCL